MGESNHPPPSSRSGGWSHNFLLNYLFHPILTFRSWLCISPQNFFYAEGWRKEARKEVNFLLLCYPKLSPTFSRSTDQGFHSEQSRIDCRRQPCSKRKLWPRRFTILFSKSFLHNEMNGLLGCMLISLRNKLYNRVCSSTGRNCTEFCCWSRFWNWIKFNS